MWGIISDSYTGWRARRYNLVWRDYERRTLGIACSLVDWAAVQASAQAQGRPAQVLDAGCGSGLLLCQLRECLPSAALYGVDPSADMLAQAQRLLGDAPDVHLAVAALGPGEHADLPFASGSFDLIVCTNVLHYLREPVASLERLADLLAPGGRLVVEDFARRAPPFPWAAFEQGIRWLDRQHVRAYTVGEARTLCASAGLDVQVAQPFAIDLVWRGWALRATRIG